MIIWDAITIVAVIVTAWGIVSTINGKSTPGPVMRAIYALCIITWAAGTVLDKIGRHLPPVPTEEVAERQP